MLRRNDRPTKRGPTGGPQPAFLTRLAAVSAVLVTIIAATATPAVANANFNAVCESAEACNFRLSVNPWDPHGGIWDFEGTDHDFRNNHYVGGSSASLDNRGTSFLGRGENCTAVFSNGYGNPYNDTEWIKLIPSPFIFYDASDSKYDNSASQLFWICP